MKVTTLFLVLFTTCFSWAKSSYKTEQIDLSQGHIVGVPFEIKVGTIGVYIGNNLENLKTFTPVKIQSIDGDALTVLNSSYSSAISVKISRKEIAVGTSAFYSFYQGFPTASQKAQLIENGLIEKPIYSGSNLKLREDERVYVHTTDGQKGWMKILFISEDSIVVSGQAGSSAVTLVLKIDSAGYFLASTPNNKDLLQRARKTCVEGVCNIGGFLLTSSENGKQQLLEVEGINPLHPQTGILVSIADSNSNFRTMSFDEAVKAKELFDGREVSSIDVKEANRKCPDPAIMPFLAKPSDCEHAWKYAPHIKAATSKCGQKNQVPDLERGFLEFEPLPGILGGAFSKIAFYCK